MTWMTRRKTWITGLFILWAAVFLASFALPWFVDPVGEGFPRGINRVVVFLGLQGGSAVLAGMLFYLTARTSRFSGYWLMGRMPGMCALLLVLLVFGLILVPAVEMGPAASG